MDLVEYDRNKNNNSNHSSGGGHDDDDDDYDDDNDNSNKAKCLPSDCPPKKNPVWRSSCDLVLQQIAMGGGKTWGRTQEKRLL